MGTTSRLPETWNEVGEWTRMERLGQGGFGSVYLGKRNSDEKLFVVKSVYFVPKGTSKYQDEAEKELKKEKYSLSNLINEIRTLRKLKSPYIIRYIGCGTSTGPPEMRGRLLLDCYLEYLPKGSLYDLLASCGFSLDEHFIKAYTKDILRALVYLHFNKIVHGDIKCANVLIDSDHCKLADFGSVKDVRTSFFSKILIGTIGYKAPEVLAHKEQTYASDIFSLGCTVVEMAVGESNNLKLLKRYPPTFKPADIPGGLSAQCKDFLSKSIGLKPASRWSARDLLKHPFITEPSSPRWRPYSSPLDPKVESKLVDFEKKGLFVLIPPSNLDESLPAMPCSPIMVAPLKRRKIDLLGCEVNEDETEVILPAKTTWKLKDELDPFEFGMAHDKHSGTTKQVVEDVKYPPCNTRPTVDTKRQRTPPGELDTEVAINRLQIETKSSKGSAIYQGQAVTFSPVADLEGHGEDSDPLVVKICHEFGIPLPPEYQKWIQFPVALDPNDATSKVSNDNAFRKFFSRKLQRPEARHGLAFS